MNHVPGLNPKPITLLHEDGDEKRRHRFELRING